MKLLTTAILGMMMSGCFAHAHPYTAPNHTHNAHTHRATRHAVPVKAWVWVDGRYRHGRWIRGHWVILDVNSNMINRYPRRYIRYQNGMSKPRHRPHRPGHHHRHRHRR